MKPLLTLLLICPTCLAVTPDTVLVVYNGTWTYDSDNNKIQDSLQIANYYKDQRNIPTKNLLALDLKNNRDITSYSSLSQSVLEPVKSKLDSLGKTNIDVIVTVFGIPRRFVEGKNIRAIDNILNAPYTWNTLPISKPNPYFEPTPSFGTDKPRFSHSSSNTINGNPVYPVCRLDSPMGVSGVTNIIDQATYASKYRTENANALVDSIGHKHTPQTDENLSTDNDVMAGNFYSLQAADVNVAWTEHFILGSQYNLLWEQTGLEVGESGASINRVNRLMLYGGWYNYNKYQPVLEWLPGSIACDVNSSSLAWYRQDTERKNSWENYKRLQITSGPQSLIHGATCVLGVVAEPFLTGHQRPHVIAWSSLRGYSYSDIAFISTPLVGWQMTSIGDPLYKFELSGKAKDTEPPTLQEIPRIQQDELYGVVIETELAGKDTSSLLIEYGTTTSYGRSRLYPQYWNRHRITFNDLQDSTNYHLKMTLIDPSENKTVTPDISFRTPKQEPFDDNTIPGKIEIEHFDKGGEGIAYHDLDPDSAWYRHDTGVDILGRPPSAQVFRVYNNEWLEYTVNVTTAGNYKVTLRAREYEGIFNLLVDKSIKAVFTPSKSGQWKELQEKLQLTEGTHVLRIEESTPPTERIRDNSYLDWISFELVDEIPLPEPITINLSQGGKPIKGQFVVADGESKSTDSDGNVTFSNPSQITITINK